MYEPTNYDVFTFAFVTSYNYGIPNILCANCCTAYNWGKIKLINEAVYGAERLIDQIRLVIRNTDHVKFLDLHYAKTTGENHLQFKVMNSASYLNNSRNGKYHNFEKVEDTPTDATVIATLNLAV